MSWLSDCQHCPGRFDARVGIGNDAPIFPWMRRSATVKMLSVQLQWLLPDVRTSSNLSSFLTQPFDNLVTTKLFFTRSWGLTLSLTAWQNGTWFLAPSRSRLFQSAPSCHSSGRSTFSVTVYSILNSQPGIQATPW